MSLLKVFQSVGGLNVSSICVFAYGSLMFEPELPDSMMDSPVLVTLPGHRRCFNKWSHVRGCKPSESRWPGMDVPDFYRTSRLNRSLVLGTEPGGGIVGVLQRYPESEAEELLQRLDRREGFRAGAPLSESGYIRAEVMVEYAGSGERQKAWTYLKNEASSFYRPGLSSQEMARILARATPRELVGPKVKGLDYFGGILRALRRLGVRDVEMESLASSVQALGDDFTAHLCD